MFEAYQFVFQLDYFVGRFDLREDVGYVLSETPYVVMFRKELGEFIDDDLLRKVDVPGDFLLTFYVEYNNRDMFVVEDFGRYDQMLEYAFKTLEIPPEIPDGCIVEDYLSTWPLRETTLTDVMLRRYYR